MPATSERPQHRLLGAPETQRLLRDYVRKRVGESDVDDVVQTVLVEALASDRAPENEAELRKWLIGVARHKIADHHRRGGREQPAELPDIETAPAPVEERELARWAEEQAHSNKEAAKTLQWMAREGEGDKLEHIAEEEQLPAARVRQRVSRMRRFMKERWLAELAAVAALAIVAFLVWRALRQPPVDIARDPNVPPTGDNTSKAPPPVAPRVAEAGERRKKALEACGRNEHRACLDGLDEAKKLDPAGDALPEIQKAREAAQKALDEGKKEQPQQQEVEPQEDSKVAPPEPSTTVPSKPMPTAPAPKSDPFEKKAPAKPKAPSKESSFDSNGPATGEVMTPPPQMKQSGDGSGTGSFQTKAGKK